MRMPDEHSQFWGIKRSIVGICAAVAICSAPSASAQGLFMDRVISAADAPVGQSLWSMGYDGLCSKLDQPDRLGCAGQHHVKIYPLDEVKILGFVTDPVSGARNVRLEHNGATGFMLADWRMWVTKDPKQTKCRDVSLQIGWTDDTVLRALGWAPDHINSTVTLSGTKQQWVYGRNYLYFDEQGFLVAMQLKGAAR
jgi:hypothetical protein